MSEEVEGARPASGNDQGEAIVIGQSLRVRSEVLGQERPLLIHLPEDYDTSPEAFPVLYLLDGSDHFHHVTGIVKHLAWAQRIPRMIVVGLPSIERIPDLSPPSSDSAFQVVMPFVGETFEIPIPETGGADRFRRFLAEEVAPFVEARYRTAKFRILVGYSLGGLFGIHSLLEQPEVFDATLAISPTLWWDDGLIPSRAPEVLAERSAATPHFLMTAGDRERASIMIEPLQEFVAALEGIEPEWLRWWYHVMPDETHQAVIHRAVYDGLETIFDDYALPEVLRFTADVSRLRSHYAAASATYGYEVRPSLFTLGTFIGAMQLDAGRLDEAVSLFRYAVDLFPGSPDAHGQLADALEKAGRLEEALRSRKEALRRAGEGHRDVEGFRMQLEELRKRMT